MLKSTVSKGDSHLHKHRLKPVKMGCEWYKRIDTDRPNDVGGTEPLPHI